MRTHPIVEYYQALRDSAPCLSRAATLPKGTKLGLEKRRAPGNTIILSQPYRRRVSTDRLNREGSQLAASLEGEPGPTPAGKTLPHSFPETSRFRRERARDIINYSIELLIVHHSIELLIVHHSIELLIVHHSIELLLAHRSVELLILRHSVVLLIVHHSIELLIVNYSMELLIVHRSIELLIVHHSIELIIVHHSIELLLAHHSVEL